MQSPAWHALRALSSRSRPTACRFLVGRRYAITRRSLRTSPSRLRDHDPSENPEIPESAYQPVTDQSPPLAKDEELAPELEAVTDTSGGAPEAPQNGKDRSGYGSASRRAGRNLRRKEIPAPELPQWFLDRNVYLRGNKSEDSNAFTQTPSEEAPDALGGEVSSTSQATQTPKDTIFSFTKDGSSTSQSAEEGITLSRHVLDEVKATISAGFRLPHAENAASGRSHVILQCPQEGGTYFLDAIGKHVAASFDADLIQLDAQDIAEIGGRYMPDWKDPRGNTLSALGYEAYLSSSAREMQHDEPADEEDEDEGIEAESNRRPRISPFPAQNVSVVPIAQFSGNISDIMKGLMGGTMSRAVPPRSSPGQPNATGVKMIDPTEVTNQARMSLLIETLLNAAEAKRGSVIQLPEMTPSSHEESQVADTIGETAVAAEDGAKSAHSEVESQSQNTIIMVRDYLDIEMTSNGDKFLQRLHDVVQRRRLEGQRIVILGTTSAKDLLPSYSKAGVRQVQSEQGNGSTRTILTPPTGSSEPTFSQHAKTRVQDINLRHLQDMLSRTASDPAQVETVASSTDLAIQLDSATLFASDLNETVWSLDRMHRLATLALGIVGNGQEMSHKNIEAALNLIDSSDNSKFEWVEKEKEQEKKRTSPSKKGATSNADSEERMRKLRKTCNSHEKKLLHGVVDPESIRTTFADVRATPETIEALKTLTSLSLVRPDAFTYGVLATDRIPGLLLYGPPGTGKTLLAKAVAKESGATVLEVSGSDVYDMYVGEGEKNIRAIFSLAKKLTPCIVFIDEADAILGSRGGTSNRTTHRELINQFLREWDGMTDMNAFIMVATNRPFDLDEASLRRLPRRILVDLPTEKDREAILGIHLKDEILASDVSLSTLASQTPFYSGSDLKNVCVAAALACVREEFESAAAAKGNAEEFKYPEKRTLELKHFNRAMEEISASISEDMGSLSAIRKFDEKYGDRKGRRKRGGGYGFATVKEGEKNVDGSARVRNQT